MVYNEEGIWEVGAARMEILPSYHESPARDFKADLLDIGSYYYEGFKQGSDPTSSLS